MSYHDLHYPPTPPRPRSYFRDVTPKPPRDPMPPRKKILYKKQKIAPTPPLRMNVFEFNVNEEPTNSTQTTDGILSVNGINITPTTNDGSLSMNGIQPTLHQRALDPGSGVVLVQGKSKKPTCVNAHTIPSCPPSYSFTHSVGRCFTCLAGTNQPLQNQ